MAEAQRRRGATSPRRNGAVRYLSASLAQIVRPVHDRGGVTRMVPAGTRRTGHQVTAGE